MDVRHPEGRRSGARSPTCPHDRIVPNGVSDAPPPTLSQRSTDLFLPARAERSVFEAHGNEVVTRGVLVAEPYPKAPAQEARLFISI